MHAIIGDIPLFIELARQKSFTAAAGALGLSVSTLSRRMAGLESKLGVPLLHRTPRSVELNENGKFFLEQCVPVAEGARQACENLLLSTKSAAGKVSFSASPYVYHPYLEGEIARFSALWPDIELHAHLSTQWVDLATEPYDVDIRVGPLPDSDLKARKLITLSPALYAAPALLRKCGAPKKPADLAALPCITMDIWRDLWILRKEGRTEGRKEGWPKGRKEDMAEGRKEDVTEGRNELKTEKIRVRALHTVNDAKLALDLATAGLGFAWLEPPFAAGQPGLARLADARGGHLHRHGHHATARQSAEIRGLYRGSFHGFRGAERGELTKN